jgi:hypothetical protein
MLNEVIKKRHDSRCYVLTGQPITGLYYVYMVGLPRRSVARTMINNLGSSPTAGIQVHITLASDARTEPQYSSCYLERNTARKLLSVLCQSSTAKCLIKSRRKQYL